MNTNTNKGLHEDLRSGDVVSPDSSENPVKDLLERTAAAVSNAMSDRHTAEDAIQLPADVIADAHYQSIEIFLAQKQYEHPIQLLSILRSLHPIASKPLTRRILTEALTNIESDVRNAYPSLRWSEQIRREYDNEKVIALENYKWDLIEKLSLSPDERDAIAAETLRDLFQRFEKCLNRLSNFHDYAYDDRPYSYLRRIAEIQFRLKPANPQLLEEMQSSVRRLAPSLLILDQEYILQEFGHAFRIPWYDERVTYAEQALNQLFASHAGNDLYRLGQIKTALLRIQTKYRVPVSDELRGRARGLLVKYVGRDGDDAENFADVFGLSREELRAAAVTESDDAITRFLNTSYCDNEGMHTGNVPYVHRLMTKYHVTVDEIGTLAGLADALYSVCTQTGAQLEKEQGAAQLATEMTKKGLQHYVPDIVRGALLRGFRSANRNELRSVGNLLNIAAPFRSHVDDQLIHIFSSEGQDQLLDLSQSDEQKLCEKLLLDMRTQKRAVEEVALFLKKTGLPVRRTMKTWLSTKNDSEKIAANGKKFKDFRNFAIIYMKNVHAIAKLEEREVGASKYLSEMWGIRSFCRYPEDVLIQQYRRDRSHKVGTKKGKTFLILYPESDWSGSFDKPEFIQKIANDAEAEGATLIIAESGKRYRCAVNVARCDRQYGLIDLAIIGGHSNGEEIEFGPGDENVFSINDLILNENNQQAHRKQRQRLDALRSHFAPDGRIILKACSTGKEGGIAERVTQHFELATQGPTTPSTIDSIDVRSGRATYHSHGFAAPSNTYERSNWWTRARRRFSKLFGR